MKKYSPKGEHFTSHDLRATGCIDFYDNNGFDVEATKRFMGNPSAIPRELYLKNIEVNNNITNMGEQILG